MAVFCYLIIHLQLRFCINNNSLLTHHLTIRDISLFVQECI